MYTSIEQLPDNIRADCTPDEQALYMRVYNQVFGQTQDVAMSTAAAWGGVKKLRTKQVSVMRKAENGDPIIGGWAMNFIRRGSSEADKDFYNTFFTRATRLLLDYYTTAPLWWEHGEEKRYRDTPIGMRHVTLVYGHGVWLDHRLHQRHALYSETLPAVENGEVSYSTDSIAHYVEEGFNETDGRVDSWPMAGCSLTRHPAETSLGPVIMHDFYRALRSMSTSKPEAREAQRSATQFFFTRSITGEQTMTPEMLAALAEFLGVEATPEAVGAALTNLLSQLSAANPPAETTAMMSELAPAVGLPETAAKADVLAKLTAIKSMLESGKDDKGEGADKPKRKPLNFEALRRFAELGQQALDNTPADDTPGFFYHGSGPDEDDEDGDDGYRGSRRSEDRRRDRHVSFGHKRSTTRKPGILDVIGAISQVQGGAMQFEMPAFKSRRTSGRDALRAMNINNAPSGGWMLNREMSSEILEALYAELVFEKLGAKVVPMNGQESLTMNRVQSGAVAYWAGSGQAVTDANAKIRAAVTLNTKELVSKSVIENKLLNNSGPQTQAFVEEDILRVMRLRMELAFLYGSGSVPLSGGSGAEPLGLYGITGVTQTNLNSASPTLDQLNDAEGRIEDTNLDYTELSWLSAKRTRRFFKKMKDSKGLPLFSEDWITNDIRTLIVQDHPFFTTTQVPLTTNGSTVTTDIFLGAWENFLIGQGQDLEMVVDTSRYVEERSTLIQVVSYVDSGVAYKEAFQILTNAKV